MKPTPAPYVERRMLLCREVMKSPPVCVDEQTSLAEVARLMRDRDVGFVVVCDDANHALGVLTDRDLVIRGCATETPLPRLEVGSIMTRGIVSCHPEDTTLHALAVMRRHRIERVVVREPGANGHPLGVLSLSDIAQYEAPTRIGRTLQRIAERKYRF